MKVLQINCVYGKGSTGKITADIHSELMKNGIESVVCYGRGMKINEPHVYKTCGELYSKMNNLWSRFSGLMYGGCALSTKSLIARIRKEQPDVVHLQCINGYFVNIYKLIEYLKKSGIPTVLTLHAEFMYTANCGYAYECKRWMHGCGTCPSFKAATKSLLFDRTADSWQRMKKAFTGFEELSVIGVSEWIADRARKSGMFTDAKYIGVITNGIDLNNFNHLAHTEEDNIVAEKYGIKRDKRMVLHVTSSLNGPFKGGAFFLELAERVKDDCRCVVVGTDEDAANDNVRCIPFTTNQRELASLYRMADVFVITSIAENYPTVCLEAQVCGTPVVGFDVGGVSETIRVGNSVPVKDIDALKENVMIWAEKKKELSEMSFRECRELFDKSRMTKDYIELYRIMTNK